MLLNVTVRLKFVNCRHQDRDYLCKPMKLKRRSFLLLEKLQLRTVTFDLHKLTLSKINCLSKRNRRKVNINFATSSS